MTLDFNKAKEGVQRIIDDSTGSFSDDFRARADDFVKVVQDSKVVTEATVNATAVQSMTPDSAVVLVAATSRVTNSAGAQKDPRAWRLSVTVTKDGGQIKMSKAEFVP
jgi:Mce-associated membrane protein